MRIKTRWQAFGIHLCISLIIFILALFVMLKYWYPGTFINLGGWQGIRIVAGVDLVLGPVLTLIVFNINKKSLKWDMSAIAFLQTSCLAVGLYLVYIERPIVQVFFKGTIQVLTKSDFDLYNLDTSPISKLDGTYPKFVYLDLPGNSQEIERIQSLGDFLGGEPLHMRLNLYQSPDGDNIKTLQKTAPSDLYNKQNDCYDLTYNSKHGTGTGCVSLTQGLLHIYDRNSSTK